MKNHLQTMQVRLTTISAFNLETLVMALLLIPEGIKAMVDATRHKAIKTTWNIFKNWVERVWSNPEYTYCFFVIINNEYWVDYYPTLATFF